MKKRKRAVIALFLVAFMFVGLFHGYHRAEAASTYEEKMKATQEKKAELERLLKEAEERKAEFEKKQQESQDYLASLSGDIDKITKYIQEVDEQLQEIYDRIKTLNFSISEKTEELEQTKKDLEDAIAMQEAQYEAMKKRIRYIYENGTESILETLINSKSIADFLNRVEYRMRITEYDKTLLERYQATTELVKANKELLEASIQNLEELKAEAEAEQAESEELARVKGEQLEAFAAAYQIEEELIFKYGEEIDNSTITIEELYEQEAKRAEEEKKIIEEEEKRLAEIERKRKEEEARKAAEQKRKEEEARKKAEAERQAALLAQRLNAANNITMTWETSVYKMIWPLPGDGRTFDGFGPRKAPLPGASTYHMGVDIGGEAGATIVAVLAGTVKSAAYNWSGGNTVVIDHGNGVVTKYCHASQLLVKAGDTVMQGQPISLCGSTGVSTSPHLHFAVILNGTYVDPLKYIHYE